MLLLSCLRTIMRKIQSDCIFSRPVDVLIKTSDINDSPSLADSWLAARTATVHLIMLTHAFRNCKPTTTTTKKPTHKYVGIEIRL